MGDIDVAFVQQFSDILIHKTQQEKTRLLPTVMSKPIVGKQGHFDLIGSTAAQKVTDRHGDTPIMDVPHSRRRFVLDTYDWGELIDKPDEIRMLVDPRSAYVKAGSMSMGRSIDDVIIAAMLGNARSIDNADASSNVAFDTNMTIDQSFGATNSNLTFAKLNDARRLLLSKEVDPDDELYCALNSSAIHSLLTESEVQSFDTNQLKPLVEGKIARFMGMTFVHTERIPLSSESFAQVLCYTKSAIGVGIGRDVTVEVGPDPSKKFHTRIYYAMDIGAVRVEEERMVLIECVQ